MSNAKSGFGSKFQYKAVGETPEVVIGELTNISGPSISAETIEVTSHQSPDGYREFIGSLKDGGEISLEGNFVASDAGQGDLIDDLNAGAAKDFEIVLPDTSKWAMKAIVTGYETGAPMDDKMTFSVTLKVTGKPTFTAAA